MAENDQVSRTSPTRVTAATRAPVRITAGTGDPASDTRASDAGMSRRRPIASHTRDNPSTRFNSTPSIATTAPISTSLAARGDASSPARGAPGASWAAEIGPHDERPMLHPTAATIV